VVGDTPAGTAVRKDEGDVVSKRRVSSFAVSIDGYGAWPNQDRVGLRMCQARCRLTLDDRCWDATERTQ